jgi:hypothetical protein
LQLATYKVKKVRKLTEEQEWKLSHADRTHQLLVMSSIGTATLALLIGAAVVAGISGKGV